MPGRSDPEHPLAESGHYCSGRKQRVSATSTRVGVHDDSCSLGGTRARARSFCGVVRGSRGLQERPRSRPDAPGNARLVARGRKTNGSSAFVDPRGGRRDRRGVQATSRARRDGGRGLRVISPSGYRSWKPADCRCSNKCPSADSTAQRGGDRITVVRCRASPGAAPVAAAAASAAVDLPRLRVDNGSLVLDRLRELCP